MIAVLRPFNRKRDKRVTTHLALVARAFGADKIIITGEIEKRTIESIEDVSARWGGKFKVEMRENPVEVIKCWNGKVVHLTMYGVPVDEIIAEIRKSKDILVVVGGKKVPNDFFKLSDYNVAVGSQPHSEISALAVFLDRYYMGKELYFNFKNAKIKVVPQKKGKKVIEIECEH